MAIVEFIDPAYVKLRLDNLDISLSSLRDAIRGTDNRTLTDIYNIGTAIRDRLPASLTTAGNLKIAILEDTVGIAKDSTLSSILNRLDVNLSTRASETTLTAVRDRLPSSLTAAGNFKIAILEDTVGIAKDTTLSSILSKLDVNLSTRASETTLSGIKSQTDKLTFDTANRLKVQLDSIPNPPNLDVTLSTRLSESTFTARVPTLSTQTLDIGGSSYAALNVVPSIGGDISRMPYTIDNISVTTTESSTSISAPGAKIIQITNKGDVDCLIGINNSVPTTNPMKVRARCSLIFVHKGATSIYYKTATGSTTISITYFN
ncbi:MAG: hypothetical protein QXN17_03720 [Nitrososphaerota archaeon]